MTDTLDTTTAAVTSPPDRAVRRHRRRHRRRRQDGHSASRTTSPRATTPTLYSEASPAGQERIIESLGREVTPTA